MGEGSCGTVALYAMVHQKKKKKKDQKGPRFRSKGEGAL